MFLGRADEVHAEAVLTVKLDNERLEVVRIGHLDTAVQPEERHTAPLVAAPVLEQLGKGQLLRVEVASGGSIEDDLVVQVPNVLEERQGVEDGSLREDVEWERPRRRRVGRRSSVGL